MRAGGPAATPTAPAAGPPLDRARAGLRRGSERARRGEARIARGLGEPALFAILLSSVVSGLFMVLGEVADDALGLTPVAFLLSGLLFVFTIATYVEGSSLHPERGGASTFARYAFDELWSFIAGWAILLDYLIVMAIGAVAISDYLAVFWTGLDEGIMEVVIAGTAMLFVAVQNVHGLGADRLRAGPAPVAARNRAARRGDGDRARAELGPGRDHRHDPPGLGAAVGRAAVRDGGRRRGAGRASRPRRGWPARCASGAGGCGAWSA